MSTLRKNLIRMAYENPELRGDLLPMLRLGEERVLLASLEGTVADDHRRLGVLARHFASLLKRDGKKILDQAWAGDLDKKDLTTLAEDLRLLSEDIQAVADRWLGYANRPFLWK